MEFDDCNFQKNYFLLVVKSNRMKSILVTVISILIEKAKCAYNTLEIKTKNVFNKRSL
jgi:hypothetical protein